MSTSDVRNVESLKRLQRGIVELADRWQKTLQELRLSIHRAEEYFTDRVPRYWHQQSELAERAVNEALDHLQQKQSAARAGDRVSAVEAQKRVRRAKDRLALCRQREKAAKTLAIEIRHQCDEILGPLAEMTEQSDNGLPEAARRLNQLLESLTRYTDASGLTPAPENPSNTPPTD